MLGPNIAAVTVEFTILVALGKPAGDLVLVIKNIRIKQAVIRHIAPGKRLVLPRGRALAIYWIINQSVR